MLCCTGANREGVSSRKRREHALIADPLDGELPEAHPKSAQKLRQTGAVGGVLCLQTSGMPLASSGVPLMPHHTGTVRSLCTAQVGHVSRNGNFHCYFQGLQMQMLQDQREYSNLPFSLFLSKAPSISKAAMAHLFTRWCNPSCSSVATSCAHAHVCYQLLTSNLFPVQAFNPFVLEPPLPVGLAKDKHCLLCLHSPAWVHLHLSLTRMQQQLHQHQQQQQTSCQPCRCRLSCKTKLVDSKHTWACSGRTASAMNFPPIT